MAAVTTIYLIRHAHAEWVPDDDRPLSPAGIAAAVTVARLLAAAPLSAIVSSPSRRAVETVSPLARRQGLDVTIDPDLREREVPAVDPGVFQQLIEDAWRAPDAAPLGGESNAAAQVRGMAALRRITAAHRGHHIAVSTHGNLLALMLNALDPAIGHAFWRELSFPDVYRIHLDGDALNAVTRLWQPAASA
jgi:2,3-bisphosphoglycerate-dependent phosphoglycerate mutase